MSDIKKALEALKAYAENYNTIANEIQVVFDLYDKEIMHGDAKITNFEIDDESVAVHWFADEYDDGVIEIPISALLGNHEAWIESEVKKKKKKERKEKKQQKEAKDTHEKFLYEKLKKKFEKEK